jgi:hypothetical protein
MKKIYVVFYFLVSIVTDIHAQNNAVTTGGVASGSGGSATYSVGQVDYVTNSGAGGEMTEGLQQPFEIFITAVDEVSSDFGVKVFPNPTTNYVEVDVANDVTNGPVICELFDMTGKSISKSALTGGRAIINMASLSSAIYLLKVTNSAEVINTYKINLTR